MIFRILLLVLMAYGVCKFPKHYAEWTGAFRLSKLQELDLEHRPEWDTVLAQEAAAILSQRFSFYKRGTESYVFLSEDGKTVLKFFSPSLIKRSWKEKILRPFNDPKQKELRLIQTLEGYSLASKIPKERSGLLYTHLNLTEALLPKVILQDGLGRTCTIPLDRCRFALQKKTDLYTEAFQRRTKDPLAIEQLIDSYLSWLDLRTSLGIRNADTEFKKNFGCLDDQALELDFGAYVSDPSFLHPLGRTEELLTFADRLRYWVHKNAPEHERVILARMAKLINP